VCRNYTKWHNKCIFELQSELWQFQTITVSECCLIKLLPYILFEKYIYILELKMASPGNGQCSNCIGTLSFPIVHLQHLGLRKVRPSPRNRATLLSAKISSSHFNSGQSWWRGTVVERLSLAGELSLSCARPAADG